MRLYAHQTDAIKDLGELCRINPDYSSSFRNDLEFYIPQICTFLLKGELDDITSLFDLILMASSSDFFFAHRVWFFFSSGLKKGLESQVALTSQKVVSSLKGVVMSPQSNSSELLYIANSQDIMRLIVDLNL